MVMTSAAPLVLDPVTVEVIRNKLDGIADEMEATLLRSSFSPVVKEGLDTSASLFTTAGETLAQACAIPIHLSALIPMVGAILRSFPVETMGEGDLFILNDPYHGGTHLPDIALIMSVFDDGVAIALTACITHHQDVGGMAPGSVPAAATEIYQEGIRIPPLKLYDRGVENRTLLDLLRLNNRIPETFIGDLNAQVAACKIGGRRLGELTRVHGSRELLAIFSELLSRSEILTRAALRRIAQGTYRYVDWHDNDGVDLETRIRIRIEVEVTVRDGTLTVRFPDPTPQVRGPVNCSASGALAAAYFAVRVIGDPTIPTNGGCFRPVHVEAPEGTLFNPIEPAPVNARSWTVQHITGCILGALGEVLPEKIPAASSGPSSVMMFSGHGAAGEPYVVGDFIVGGSGASHRCDGVDAIETETTNGMNLPCEALELVAPIRIHRFELRRDSGGAGEFRGGLGTTREYECLAEEMVFTHRGGRHFEPAQGARGGLHGAPAYSMVVRADGTRQVIASKLTTVLKRGDRVIAETAGGGGYGDPQARAPASVSDDLANGKISGAAARDRTTEGQ